ncbi:MAG: MlaD family protein [Candidatus Omnitrophota bacterium]
MKKYSNELKVGIFFIICIIGLLYLTISTGKFHLKDEGYNIYVIFDDVSGLQKNSSVMINGLELGRVQELKTYSQEGRERIRLKLLINKDTKIWDGCEISIKTLGLMGEKYVHIKSSQGKEYVRPESLLIGKVPTDMDVLFSQAEVLMKETAKLAQTLNGTVEENRQSLSKSVSNIGEITEQLKLTLKDNAESLDNIIKNFESTSTNFEEFSQDLKKHPWKLLFRPKEKK